VGGRGCAVRTSHGPCGARSIGPTAREKAARAGVSAVTRCSALRPTGLRGQDGNLLRIGAPRGVEGIDGAEMLPHAAVVSAPITFDERHRSSPSRPD
jgi:hypothetical protein